MRKVKLHIPLARNKVGRRRVRNSVRDSLEAGQAWVGLSVSLLTGEAWVYVSLERKEANKRTETEGIESLHPTLALTWLEKLALGTKQKHCWLFLSFPCSAASVPPPNPGCCERPCPLEELDSCFIEESALMQVRDIILQA